MADDQKALDKKLRRAAGKGRIVEMEKLLAAGAALDGRTGFFSRTPLAGAACHGQAAAAEFLIKKGANLETQNALLCTPLAEVVQYKPNAKIVALLLSHGADPAGGYAEGQVLKAAQRDRARAFFPSTKKECQAIIDLLEAALKKKEQGQKAAEEKANKAKKEQAEERARLQAETEKTTGEAERLQGQNLVTFRQQLLDRMIEETYNFAARERITFVRKGPQGPVEAVTRQNFSELAETPGLRAAFDEHRRRGGSVEESAVFPDRLGKPKALPRGGPDV